MKVKEIIQLFFGAKKTAAKQHNISAGTIWFETDDQDEADALATLAIKKAGYKRSDFFKPVRVDHLVVDETPGEGVFDTAFCDRYKIADDGKSWLLPVADGEEHDTISSDDEQDDKNGDSADGNGGTVDDPGTDDGPEGLGYNVNGEPMADVIREMDHPVVGMSLTLRWMAQMGKEQKTLHVSPSEYEKIISMTEPQNDGEAPLLNDINLLLQGDLAPELDKLDLQHLFRLVKAVEKVTSADERMRLHLLHRFVRAWLDTEYINQGLLVKAWCEGRRVAGIEMPTSGEDAAATSDEGASQGRPRRSQMPTYRTLNHEIACALYDGELDLFNLRQAMDEGKRIIADDREDWKRWSAAMCAIPSVLNYDRQSIIECIRSAPDVVNNPRSNLHKDYAKCWLIVNGVMDADWQAQSVPVADSHEENLERIRSAAKYLRGLGSMENTDPAETPTTGLVETQGDGIETETTSIRHQETSEETRQDETDKAEAVMKAGDGIYDITALIGNQPAVKAVNNDVRESVKNEIAICLLKEILIELKGIRQRQSDSSAKFVRIISHVLEGLNTEVNGGDKQEGNFS